VRPIARNFLQNLQAITGLISPFDSPNSDFLRDGKIFPNNLIFIDILYFKGKDSYPRTADPGKFLNLIIGVFSINFSGIFA